MHKNVNVMDHAHEDVPAALLCMSDGEQLTVYAFVTGEAVRCDYGVPGSPAWYEVEDIDVHTFEINGVDMSPREAEVKFGRDAVNALREMAVDAADDGEDWEQ